MTRPTSTVKVDFAPKTREYINNRQTVGSIPQSHVLEDFIMMR